MDTIVVAASEAKTKFFELVKRAKAGESFLITLDGNEAARLTPIKERPSQEELDSLFARVDAVRKGTVLNPPGAERVTIRQLMQEGRK